jgi:hypothetical protein
MEKATKELKTRVENHTRVQRFFHHDNTSQKLKSLQEMVNNFCNLMQLQALCPDRRDDFAGDQWTCVLLDLEIENREQKRLIEVVLIY